MQQSNQNKSKTKKTYTVSDTITQIKIQKKRAYHQKKVNTKIIFKQNIKKLTSKTLKQKTKYCIKVDTKQVKKILFEV